MVTLIKPTKGIPLPPVPGWPCWIMGISCCLLLLLAHGASAQAVKRPPVREGGKEKLSNQVPAKGKEAAPLSPKQLEEALRLLLQVTGDSAATTRPPRTLEIGGLIVDQTISKVGHDFYDIFYTQFEAPAGVDDYVVTIIEKPGRGINTLIAVSVNDRDLLEMPLQPKQDYVEAAAAEALSAVLDYLQEEGNVSRQLEKGARQPLEVF